MNEAILFFREEMKKTLDSARYEHTLGVAYTAAALAFRYEADVEKALTAGLLHDCAKCLSHAERLRISEENGLEVREVERENPSLLHAKVGAFLAKTRYGVTDEDVLHAIESHTTGHAAMSLLEKIIYLADFIEPNRKELPKLPAIRKAVFEDIDLAMEMTLKNILEYLTTTGQPIDPLTKEAFAYYSKGH